MATDRPTPRLLREGQQIDDGKVVVECLLGEGASAEVYRVRHRYLGRQALKVFRGAGLTGDEIEAVLAEAKLLTELGHPNIVRVFDAGTVESSVGSSAYFTMEHAAGGDLVRFWRSFGHRFVPVPTAVDAVAQVCRGLAAAHGASPPIVHRDVKPNNIVWGYDGESDAIRFRVSDFSLAKRVNPLSLMATARGTVTFKAPETFVDPTADSCRGDVWAVGMVAYLLLTDRLPYDGLTVVDLVRRTPFDRPVPAPGDLNLAVDAQLDRIVLRALAVDPADRYPSAGAMLADLAAWSAATPPEDRVDDAQVTSKDPVGVPASPFDQSDVAALAAKADELGRQFATLPEALALAHEVQARSPELGERFADRVGLWRKGIVR